MGREGCRQMVRRKEREEGWKVRGGSEEGERRIKPLEVISMVGSYWSRL